MNLFIRNSPEVIKDSIDLSLEEFVAKYKPRTKEEVLSQAYLEIRRKEMLKNPPPQEPELPRTEAKKVTFKVFKTKPNINMQQKEIVSEASNAADSGFHNESEVSGTGADTVSAEKKERKKRDSSRGEQRDARILELLKEPATAKEIIEIMAGEGFKVHAPQVSVIKKANEAEIKKAIEDKAPAVA